MQLYGRYYVTDPCACAALYSASPLKGTTTVSDATHMLCAIHVLLLLLSTRVGEAVIAYCLSKRLAGSRGRQVSQHTESAKAEPAETDPPTTEL